MTVLTQYSCMRWVQSRFLDYIKRFFTAESHCMMASLCSEIWSLAETELNWRHVTMPVCKAASRPWSRKAILCHCPIGLLPVALHILIKNAEGSKSCTEVMPEVMPIHYQMWGTFCSIVARLYSTHTIRILVMTSFLGIASMCQPAVLYRSSLWGIKNLQRSMCILFCWISRHSEKTLSATCRSFHGVPFDRCKIW